MKRTLVILVGMASLLAAPACLEDNPCPGPYELSDFRTCSPADAGGADSGGADGGDAGGTDAGGADTGSAGAAGAAEMPVAMDVPFGTACMSDADCGGDTAICVNDPRAPVGCTNILCQDGEANAGICPPDWTCLQSGDNPSTCLKF